MKSKVPWINDASKTGLAFRQYASLIVITITIVLCIFSDIIRGMVWLYTLFLVMGLGISIWLVGRKDRFTVAFALAPAIGYACISILGSWLVALDFPVSTWANSLSVAFISFNLLLFVIWKRKNSVTLTQVQWKTVLNDLSLGYLGIIVAILPVVIGGMKFSTFRGNPDDAHNYMSMAFYLTYMPFSGQTNINLLFQKNPALYLGGKLLYTRWGSSMLMAYASFIAHVPIYRFDFAFSVLPFGLLLIPVYKTLKETRLGNILSMLLALGISTGYYEQVIVDMRAVAHSTGLPVLFALVFFIVRIWDNRDDLVSRWSTYLGEIIILVLLITALFALYPEILLIMGLGILIAVPYYILQKTIQLRKALLISLSGVCAAFIIYFTMPFQLKFFLVQVGAAGAIGDQSWISIFYSWLFDDFPDGAWGLNPYQLNRLLISIFQSYAYVLSVILVVAWLFFIVGRARMETIHQISGFIITGAGIFALYFYIHRGYWQIGKIVTYIYPFAIIFAAFIPYVIRDIKFPTSTSIFYNISQYLIFSWIILFVSTSAYRFLIVEQGSEYPFYLKFTGHTVENYHQIYNWEIEPFLHVVRTEPRTVIWLAGNTAYEDILWGLSLPPNNSVFNTNPITGSVTSTIEPSLAYLSRNIPDYLIISNDIEQWNKDLEFVPVLSDQEFSLIKLSHQLPHSPMLIGLRNSPQYYHPYHQDFWVGTEGWLEFLSPGNCEATITSNSLIANHSSDINLAVTALPANETRNFTIKNKGIVDIPIPLQKGYNFISLQVVNVVDAVTWEPTIYFPDMHINYNCSS